MTTQFATKFCTAFVAVLLSAAMLTLTVMPNDRPAAVAATLSTLA